MNTIVTTVQNNSTINATLAQGVQNLKSCLDAQVIVLNNYYNTNNLFSAQQEEKEETVYPLLVCADSVLNHSSENLNINGWLISPKIRVLPTAQNPFSSLEKLAQFAERGLIVGHSSLNYKALPRLFGQNIKYFHATGYATEANYTCSKAGAIGELNHTIGCLLIDHEGNAHTLELRENQLIYNGFDYINMVEVLPTALVLPDLHTEQLSKQDIKRLNNLVQCDLYDEVQYICHDTLDFKSNNHHERSSLTHKMTNNHTSNILKSVGKVADRLDAIFGERLQDAVIVYSNHDDMLARYCAGVDLRQESQENTRFVVGYLEQLRQGNKLGAFHFAYCVVAGFTYDKEKLYYSNGEETPYFMASNESMQLNGVELGLHGHVGSNGSKSIAGAVGYNSGLRMVTGHTHTPQRNHNHAVVGVVSLDHGYNTKGLSSWDCKAVEVYPNGAMNIVHF
jgi:hypothetical protein